MATNVTRDHHLWTRDTVKNVSGDVTLHIDGDINLTPDGVVKITSTGTTAHALEIDATALTTGRALDIDVVDTLTASATKSLVVID